MSLDLYNTGVGGLNAAQQQLATTSHNISNANTEGYTRQRAEQTTLVGNSYGNNFIGSGTYVNDITRLYEQFSYKEQLINTSKLGAAASSEASLSQLNELMSYAGGSLTSSIDSFYSAMNGITDNPSDAGLRSIAISQAETVTNDFRTLSESFAALEKSHNGEIANIASKVTQISYDIARINEEILNNRNFDQSGQPNDLLDKRDQLITELAEYTTVNTVSDSNGVMTVMIGNGSTLVSGITPLSLEVKAGDPDPLKTELLLKGPHAAVAINSNAIGGELSAKFEFRDNALVDAKNQIDRLALAFSHTVNTIQAEGLDVHQTQGSDLFSDINSTLLQTGRVLGFSGNTPTLQAQVEITDVSLLPTDEFEVKYDGVNYVATNLTTMATETLVLTAPNTYASSQGFNFIETSGTAVSDDKFIVRPAENTAAFINVQLANGDGIAASSAVKVTPSENNIGGGQVTISQTYDPEAARSDSNIEIEILESSPGTYTYVVNDLTLGTSSAAQTYTPPSQFIDFPLGSPTPSFQVEIKGLPAGNAPFAPEVFTLSDAYGLGNSQNAQKLAATQELGVINKGQETFVESLSVTTASVGSQAKTAELMADTAQVLHTQAYNRNQATSGVNLDEEAANLIRFQQAYQASSQIISVANTIFDTLLSVAR